MSYLRPRFCSTVTKLWSQRVLQLWRSYWGKKTSAIPTALDLLLLHFHQQKLLQILSTFSTKISEFYQFTMTSSKTCTHRKGLLLFLSHYIKFDLSKGSYCEMRHYICLWCEKWSNSYYLPKKDWRTVQEKNPEIHWFISYLNICKTPNTVWWHESCKF